MGTTTAHNSSMLVKNRDLLRFTTAGSVDDGKSTLIGRLLFDSKQIFQDQLDQLVAAGRLRGEENVNLALLTDGLRAEREQGITIDVAYRYFSTAKRKFIIADTPGHEQYTRNMVTGASTADLAILLIDARNGILTQSKRHGIIAGLLGIPHVVVCVNKMDLVDYSRERFTEIVEEYQEFALKLNVNDMQFIPVSALKGDNVVNRSAAMPWYEGPPLLQYLENVTISADRNLVDFRFPVQYVIRPHQDFRGFSGAIASGTIRVGEEVIVLPGMRHSRIKGIHFYKTQLEEASEGQSVIITLEDEVDVSRGDMLVRRHNIPHMESEFEATLAWMDERHTLSTHKEYILQHTTSLTRAYVDSIIYQLDVNTLHRSSAETLALNEIGRVKLTTARRIFFDSYERNRWTGGFILIDPDDFRTIAAGMIRHYSRNTINEIKKEQRDRKLESSTHSFVSDVVQLTDRIDKNGHKPICVWFLGGQSTVKDELALRAERALFDRGCQVVRIDTETARTVLGAGSEGTDKNHTSTVMCIGRLSRYLCNCGNIVICTIDNMQQSEIDALQSLSAENALLTIEVDDAKERTTVAHVVDLIVRHSEADSFG
ncbi:MAG: sulfate adenylyltransferase subunit CysN [Chitinivibrionales bacterium]|nr:sulfate adenylyltransferase subunit CysN [Chitinivibrionales bacterium]